MPWKLPTGKKLQAMLTMIKPEIQNHPEDLNAMKNMAVISLLQHQVIKCQMAHEENNNCR